MSSVSARLANILKHRSAGNTSLVFDCLFHTSVKSRTLRDPEFKVFLIGTRLPSKSALPKLPDSELSLERVEAQTGLTLSRSISMPNIFSKGKLLPRTVQIPASMLSVSPKGSKNVNSTPEFSPITTKNSSLSPLIQELSSELEPSGKSNTLGADTSKILPGLRGILKSSLPASSASIPETKPVIHDEPLFWTWSKVENGASVSNSSRIKFEVHIPNLVCSSFTQFLPVE